MRQSTEEVPQPIWGEVGSIQDALASARRIDNAGEEALVAVVDDIAAGKLAAGNVHRRYLSLRRNRRRKHARRLFLVRREAGYYAVSGRLARKPTLDSPQARLPRRPHLADSDVDRLIHDLDNKRLVERLRRLVSADEWSLLKSFAQDATVAQVAHLHRTTPGAVKTKVSRIRTTLRNSDIAFSKAQPDGKGTARCQR